MNDTPKHTRTAFVYGTSFDGKRPDVFVAVYGDNGTRTLIVGAVDSMISSLDFFANQGYRIVIGEDPVGQRKPLAPEYAKKFEKYK
jgi:hypothetical protein